MRARILEDPGPRAPWDPPRWGGVIFRLPVVAWVRQSVTDMAERRGAGVCGGVEGGGVACGVRGAVAGSESGFLVLRAVPGLVAAVAALGVVYASYGKRRCPKRHLLLGRRVLEETKER